ncbi:hypothetical protein WG66_008009 [Moniliophthora roreri]|uniref:MYND-type domain-containing protein n=1 Tax=Moniliophthora roreri TaxID=221103 RepID=A0A0W0G3R8_MONRR|nr:hypothetical protein WG66_008009 [Moniliophthora roreri]
MVNDRVNAKYACDYCNQEFPSPKNLQKCGRCQSVQYCSKQCQIAAWRIHKRGCNANPRDIPEEKGGHEEKADTTLSKWIDAWRPCLEAWATWAMGVEGKPINWLQKNWCANIHIPIFAVSDLKFLIMISLLIELEDRPEPTSAIEQRFLLRAGAVVPREKIVEYLEEQDTDPIFIQDFTNDTREPFAIQIVVMAPCQLVRILWFSVRDWETRRAGDNEHLADVIKRYWVSDLKDVMEEGDVVASTKFPERMSMRIAIENFFKSREICTDLKEEDEWLKESKGRQLARRTEERSKNVEETISPSSTITLTGQ